MMVVLKSLSEERDLHTHKCTATYFPTHQLTRFKALYQLQLSVHVIIMYNRKCEAGKGRCDIEASRQSTGISLKTGNFIIHGHYKITVKSLKLGEDEPVLINPRFNSLFDRLVIRHNPDGSA